jgi:protein-tyrosine kinase
MATLAAEVDLTGFEVAPGVLAEPALPLVLREPQNAKSEAIRSLRTRIVAQHVREGRRALAMCTPNKGSGCSFVAANLAAAMAAIGQKTVLIDTDLRDPSIAAAFGLAEDHTGLADYLADPAVAMDAIIASEVMPRLSIIPAGAVPHNPQELLSSHRFRDLVNQLLREFDLTIFDTTPTNGCTDAQRVATVAGYSLIVARRDKSFVSDVRLLARMLRADKSTVVGTVLNEY